MELKLSVIINTLDRPTEMVRCLESLKNQTDKDFEVVVVDQSRNNKTKLLCQNFNLKYIANNSRNLSVSRNRGIQSAAGDIIAFVDDDAEAKPDWVERIKADFLHNRIEVLGGRVENRKDAEHAFLQFQNGIVSKYGYIEDIHPLTETKYQTGHHGWYLRPMGTNASFLKTAITEVGGFDEYYEYNHDETDLSIRIIRNRGRAMYDDLVHVDHYPANSHNRKGEFAINWRVQSKNNLYFGLKNGGDILPVKLMRSVWRVINAKGPFLALLKLLREKKINPLRFLYYWNLAQLGFVQGLLAGLFRQRILKTFSEPTPFILFSHKA